MLRGDRVQPPSAAEFKQLLVSRLNINTFYSVITGEAQVERGIRGRAGTGDEEENAKR